jgi:hypothetical protein
LRFPTLSAVDLSGNAREIPDGLPRGPRAIVLAFEMLQRRSAAEWVARLDEVGREVRDLAVCELVVLSDGYRGMGEYIATSKRDAVPDAAMRERIFVAYTDLRAFSSELALPSLRDCCAFLLDERGIVYWRSTCPVDDGKLATFRSGLAKL